ncbi:hypothetical protein GGF32_007485 [Allomyces javanicus]|nr:hypothetical protein GGF32_007485 [Allomyces javanicus]
MTPHAHDTSYDTTASFVEGAAEAPAATEGEFVWYLGYGSNMNPKVLTGRRKVVPVESVPVRVPGYKLTFDCPGFPFVEPSFASINVRPDAADPVPELHGVAFKITRAEYAMIVQTEGLHYGDVHVLCHPTGAAAQAHAPFYAIALIIKPPYRRAGLAPSVRYKGLLVDGAHHHALPDTYQTWLQSLPAWAPTTFRHKIARVVQFAWAAPIFLTLMGLRGVNRAIRGKDAPPPRIINWMFDGFSKLVWVSYQYGARYVFGNGGEVEHAAMGTAKL